MKIAIANAGYTDKIKIGMDVAASGMTLACFDDLLPINNYFNMAKMQILKNHVRYIY